MMHASFHHTLVPLSQSALIIFETEAIEQEQYRILRRDVRTITTHHFFARLSLLSCILIRSWVLPSKKIAQCIWGNYGIMNVLVYNIHIPHV